MRPSYLYRHRLPSLRNTACLCGRQLYSIPVYRHFHRCRILHLCTHPLALQNKTRTRLLLLVGMLQTEKRSAALNFNIQLHKKTFLEGIGTSGYCFCLHIQFSRHIFNYCLHSCNSKLLSAFHPHFHKKSTLVSDTDFL